MKNDLIDVILSYILTSFTIEMSKEAEPIGKYIGYWSPIKTKTQHSTRHKQRENNEKRTILWLEGLIANLYTKNLYNNLSLSNMRFYTPVCS